jgi:hypothetical protein
LPPVPLVLFTPGVNDTGGKLAAGVNDAGGKLPPVSTTQAAYLPPVSFEMVIMGYSGFRGKLTYENSLKVKISCQTPFNIQYV